MTYRLIVHEMKRRKSNKTKKFLQSSIVSTDYVLVTTGCSRQFYKDVRLVSPAHSSFYWATSLSHAFISQRCMR